MPWIIQKTVDLAHPPTTNHELPYLLMLPGNRRAHKWEITVLDNGQPADLTGYTASGHFLRRDGTGVTCSGEYVHISGNVVTVTFRQECYNVSGKMRGVVNISSDETISITLADRAFYVQPTVDSANMVIDEFIPSIADLLNSVSRLEQANAVAMVLLALNGITTAHVDNGVLYIDKIPVTDEDAYEVAVEAGYTGTEQEWDAFVAMVTDNSAMITQAATNASAALSVANSKASASSASVTIAASAWTGNEAPYTATVQCAAATASNTLTVGVGGSMTAAQYKDIAQARLVCTGQGAGTITLTAFGKKPENSITVSVMGVNT